MQKIKEELYQLCTGFINERIQNAEEALKQAQQASTDDTKSSAGDKYETGREMAQQDINRNMQLLADAQQQKALLLALNTNATPDVIKNGTLVLTNNGNFYLSISAGQFTVKGVSYFALSPVAPLGKLLMGKRKGDDFTFNQRNYQIKELI
ncbi:GreA/GreB family elongation factor [Pedobacter montanisoli]|uniref:GreA/GreB family elongation factor n=1 Tax=Pedobacter montanisoli TaxID=2923277 RepID=A0ABS9ZXK9_9SPHI|nr:GreA/GreB family elongation factor [Pedobacter montanisoli]MCJ0743024.1 GreA/GreB family elongation factor [Pedobacter montanisoli]